MPADSSVDLTVQAASLSVIDPSEPDSERQQVQSTMTGKEVLNAQKYRFTSTRVTAEKKTDEGWEIMVEGRLHSPRHREIDQHPTTPKCDGWGVAHQQRSLIAPN